jgi:hypothetical protein
MTVEERLARLERQNRWIRRLGTLGLSVIAIAVLTGQGKDEDSKALRAHELRIVDAEGRTRILLAGEGGLGHPVLILYGKEMTSPSVQLTVNEQAAHISASAIGSDTWKGARASLAAYGPRGAVSGHATIVADSPELHRVALTAWNTSGTVVEVSELTGKPLVEGIPETAEPRERIALRLRKGGPTIDLLGDDGKVIWRAPK